MQLNKLTWREHEALGDIATSGSVVQEYHYRNDDLFLAVWISK